MKQLMKSPITLESAKQSAILTIGGLCASLINQVLTEITLEGSFVVLAIRRSSNDLQHASLEEIGRHIHQMSPDSFRGFASNVKGIYHELLVVADENSDGDEITAQIFEMTNYPGADIRFFENNQFLTDVQLKAVQDPAIINRHFEKYPDIQVMATEEVASVRDDVISSGHLNEELSQEVEARSEDLSDLTPISQAEDLVAPVGLTSAIIQARDVLKGRKSVNDASSQALQDMGVAVTSSLLIDLMFSS
jgi:hypothetical protein